MASDEHQNLAKVIKCIHKKLRDDTRRLGEKRAWAQHLMDATSLQSYSTAMHDLATTHWSTSGATSKRPKFAHKERSRIEWTVKYCKEYFEGVDNGQLVAQRLREMRVLGAMKEANEAIETATSELWAHRGKLRLLDVGSCYNPFDEFEQFDVLAVDIAPANQKVRQCDFLSVDLVEAEEDVSDHPSEGALLQIPRSTFDVIVFSLLLEYMPTSQQRLKCCQTAFDLLRPEGILVVITPDSKHVGANAKLVKNWRYALSLMGFNRIRIEKLEHLTCMVFRKAINVVVAHRWARIHKEDYMTNAIHIPQDFTTDENENAEEKS